MNLNVVSSFSARRHPDGHGVLHGRRRGPRPSDAIRVRQNGTPGSARKGMQKHTRKCTNAKRLSSSDMTIAKPNESVKL